MPVNCKSDEEINPQTGKCRKKCKSNQIRNPESGRCVKRSGALGKKIQNQHKSPQHKSPQHKSPQHKSPQHKSPQHKSPQHKSPQHKSPQHKSPQHKSPQHKSPQHKSPQHKSPQHKSPQHKSPQHKSPQQSNCNSDEEINPQTGKCRKKCKSDQIRNPESGRCVKRSGALGKKILQNQHKSPQHKSPQHKSPQHKSPQHKSPQHKSPQHKSPQHKSPQHKSPKHKSPQHKSPQHKSPKHKSPQQSTLSPDSGGRDSECKNDEVFDIVSGRCIRKSTVVGAAILANRKIDMSSLSPQMLESGIIIPRGSDVDATNYSHQYDTYMGVTMFEKVFAMYLQRRHKNVCAWGATNSLTQPDIRLNVSKSIPALVREMGKYEHQFEVCDKENKRFTIFLLVLSNLPNSVSHANVVIYDRYLKTLERYEPHGGNTDMYRTAKIDSVFRMFTKKYLKKVTYIAPIQTCPLYGHQYYENTQTQSPTFLRSGDPLGFCLAWSMWYADLRLSNPAWPKDMLISKSIEILKNKPQTMRRFIRNYSSIMLRIIRKITIHLRGKSNIDGLESDEQIHKIIDESVRKYAMRKN